MRLTLHFPILVTSCVKKWHDCLVQLYRAGLLQVSVFTITQHYLVHIPGTIKALGPLRAYGARALERAIGEFSRRIGSSSLPGQNAGDIMVDLARICYVSERYREYLSVQVNLFLAVFLILFDLFFGI